MQCSKNVLTNWNETDSFDSLYWLLQKHSLSLCQPQTAVNRERFSGSQHYLSVSDFLLFAKLDVLMRVGSRVTACNDPDESIAEPAEPWGSQGGLIQGMPPPSPPEPGIPGRPIRGHITQLMLVIEVILSFYLQ